LTFLASALVVVLAAPAGKGAAGASGVDVRVQEGERRVDVTVDGTAFTSYLWPESLTKPVLFPVLTAKGTPVTRGFPLAPRPGERTDHPHHAGLWLSYGDVNGVDFWNNSSALPAEQQAKMGRSVHRRVVAASSGKNEGRLRVAIEWTLPDGTVLLDEDTTFVFRASGASGRSLDRISRLTARATPVLLADNKEGFLGLRVARSLEQPSKEPVTLTDASGRPTTVEALDNTGVTGVYRSSEGKEGDAVWGTRGRWVSLSGRVGEEETTLAILDDPKNPGAPTYWHARGYGLFAANPLGQKVFSEGREALNLKILPRQTLALRYRLLVLPGIVTPRDLDDAWEAFRKDAR
jgi:hypothetical protein